MLRIVSALLEYGKNISLIPKRIVSLKQNVIQELSLDSFVTQIFAPCLLYTLFIIYFVYYILCLLYTLFIIYVAGNNSIANSHPVFRSPPAPIKQPSLTSDMTHPQYRKFLIDWNVYKKITGLPTTQIAPHLYSACDDTVQSSIINSHTNFFELEDTMLEIIESVATKRANPAVHRMNFSNNYTK